MSKLIIQADGTIKDKFCPHQVGAWHQVQAPNIPGIQMAKGATGLMLQPAGCNVKCMMFGITDNDPEGEEGTGLTAHLSCGCGSSWAVEFEKKPGGALK